MQVSNDGKKGGLLIGETDKDGGIGIKAKTPAKEVLLGGGEIIINEESAKKHCEQLSEINVDGGGIPIPCNVEGNTSSKIAKVLQEFKEGILKTSYGTKVTDPKQAMAIAMSEERRHRMEEGGNIDEAKKKADEFVANLSEEQLSEIKKDFEKVKSDAIEKEQIILNELNEQKDKLIAEKKAQDELKNYHAAFDIRDKVSVLDKKIRNTSNAILAIKNGGDTSSFTDKKEFEHTGIPTFTTIKTDFISFDEETILTDPLPNYIPLIDEEIFARKGYIFDAIRIDKDIYILATNGYQEHARQTRSEENLDITKPAPDYEQGYVIVTLDQLALINDYYHKKAKANIEKRAQEADRRNEEHYDKLPRERREKHLNQTGFYNTLPAIVKKRISQSEYEALNLEEKEKHYKPFAKGVRKRLNSKLGDNSMWVSFHEMYERFINPLAVPINKDGTPAKSRGYGIYGNPETFEYWYKFRYMMDWKIKDIAVQRQFESDIRAAAIETSFGESNTDTILKEQYGILVKRQNGEKINPNEIEQVRKAWEGANKSFGTLVGLAKDDNLKISHTGKTLVFASKAVGMYIPKMKTIAVSAKLGDNQFENIMAHEVAHWIDNTLGSTTGHRYASDDFESKAGIIGDTMRKGMNKRSESDYINSTKECFARSLEQYYAIETHGQEATVIANYAALDVMRPYFAEDAYVPKEVYDNKLRPLIVSFIEENKQFFKSDIPPIQEVKITNEIEQKQELMETTIMHEDDNVLQEKTVEEYKKELSGVFFEQLEEYEKSEKSKHWLGIISATLSTYFSEVVSKRPEELGSFLELQKNLPNKIKVMSEWAANKEWNEEFLKNLNTNIWKLIPEQYKAYKLPKRVLYSPEKDDKGLHNITSEFVGYDELRPILMGVHFDKEGITSTDANKLLFLAHSSDREEGNYCLTKDCLETQVDIKTMNYPKYKQVVPNNTKFVSIHAESLINYLKTVIAIKYFHNVVNETILTFDNESEFAFNARILLPAIEVMYKLGYEQIDIGYSMPNRAITICKKGELKNVPKFTTDFALVMPIMIGGYAEFYNGKMYFHVESECVATKGIADKSCLNPVEIEKEKNNAVLKKAEDVLEQVKQERTQYDSKVSAQKIADQLMKIDAGVQDILKIESGSQLYEDIVLQRGYKRELDEKTKGKFTIPLPMQVYEIIEDDNYHSLNQYLTLSGAFGEEEKQKKIEYLDSVPAEKKQYFLDSSLYRPEIPISETVKPTKEVLAIRLKIVKKMYAKKPSATLKTRIKIIEKMLSQPEKYCGGGMMKMNGGGFIDSLILKTSGMDTEITNNPFRIPVYRKDGTDNIYVFKSDIEPIWMKQNKERSEINKIVESYKKSIEKIENKKRTKSTQAWIKRNNEVGKLKRELDDLIQKQEALPITVSQIAPKALNLVYNEDGTYQPVHEFQSELLHKHYGDIYKMETGGSVWTPEQRVAVQKLDEDFDKAVQEKGIQRNSKDASDFWRRDGFQKIMHEIFSIEKKSKGGSFNVDKKYTHFAVRKSDGKIVTGWDYKGTDPLDIKDYTKMDLKDMELKPSDFTIKTKKRLVGEGVDPFDWAAWRNAHEL